MRGSTLGTCVLVCNDPPSLALGEMSGGGGGDKDVRIQSTSQIDDNRRASRLDLLVCVHTPHTTHTDKFFPFPAEMPDAARISSHDHKKPAGRYSSFDRCIHSCLHATREVDYQWTHGTPRFG